MTIKTDDFAPAPDKRVVSAAPASPHEEALERALRPKGLAEYVGQAKTREQLEIFIGAARKRGEALDHVLLFGPPGLGKTTLSHIIANELGVNLRSTSGPVLEKPKDLAALLTNLERNDVLFIDEIHRLSPVVEEILYPALEDYQIDIMIGEGPAARSIKLDLQPFTLVGATTRAGMLTNPLRDRFGIVARLEFYTAEELARIVHRSAGLLHARHDTDRQPPAAPGARLRGGERHRPHRPGHRAEGAGDARCRSARLRRDGPQAAGSGDPPLRWWARGAGQRGGFDRRGARHDRGCDRAVFDPARVFAAHAAWTDCDDGGVSAPGSGAALAGRGVVRRVKLGFALLTASLQM